MAHEADPNFAPLLPRLFSLAYETLLLATVLLGAAVMFYAIEQLLAIPHMRAVLQMYLLASAWIYFVWQWTRGGQTLPMRTWKLRLVTQRGGAMTVARANARFVLGLAGLALCGLGFVWALFDRQHQFLHDRFAGTRIIRSRRPSVAPATTSS